MAPELRGRAAQTAGYSERTRLDTMRSYETALRIDPDYALAWARLAEFCARTYNSGFDRGDGLVSKARSAAAAALRLAPDLPEARLAQARILQNFENDTAGAARELDAVERLRPDLVTLDVQMPTMDGIGFLREVRRRAIPLGVVMVSGLTAQGARATTDALLEGAFDSILKPAMSDLGAGREALATELSAKIAA